MFSFGFKRNAFDDKYESMYEYAMGASLANTNGGGKKKGRKEIGRKEISLKDLLKNQQELFTGDGGSHGKEWRAWRR